MKTYNSIKLAGRIHNYELEVKVDESGNEAIVGSVTLEVNKDGATVESRFFALPKYNNGNINKTYTFLDELMAGSYKTVLRDGDEADWLSIDGKISVNYYVGRDGCQNIDDMLYSQKIRGSFINVNKNQEYLNSWNCDMLITKVEEIEANPERGYDRKARVYGYIIDDYGKKVQNVRFEALDEAPINYLLSLPVSFDSPYYTSIKGEFRKVVTVKEIEGAFGDSETQSFENIFWTVTFMPRKAYEFGEDISVDDYQSYLNKLDEHKRDIFNKHNDAKNETDNLVF